MGELTSSILMILNPNGLATVVCLPSGEYSIGSDLIPHSSPQHPRKLQTSIWIDAVPVSWAHFEVFVASAGYRREEFWEELLQEGENELPAGSVDDRCRSLMEGAQEFRNMLGLRPQEARRLPLAGISWFEACAICRFYGARLPYEVEWEAAMQGGGRSQHKDPSDSWPSAPTSRVGCKLFLGSMQEWVADAYQQYFRADLETIGSKWHRNEGGRGVVVRGTSRHDVHQDICYRTSCDPYEGDRYRGFRRVWDAEPTTESIHAFWGTRAG